MKHILILLFVLLDGIAALSAQAEIYSCKDAAGKTLFTDNKRDCAAEPARIAVKTTKDTRVNYRYPAREYLSQPASYTLFTESPESKKDTEQLAAATKRLTDTLDHIFEKIPASSHEYLQSVSFYIMIGPRAARGGESNGLRYYPKKWRRQTPARRQEMGSLHRHIQRGKFPVAFRSVGQKGRHA